MWMLALGGVFLATAQACVFCRLPDRNLLGRVARLCSQMEVHWKDCEASWNFSAFALDEVTMNKITEKTHRVLRVMEIKGTFSSLPSYCQWLQKTKLPEYIREGTAVGRDQGLCALLPAVSRKGKVSDSLSPAGGSTILYNCSTCEGTEVYCWPRKRCFPGPCSTSHPCVTRLDLSPSIDWGGPQDHSLPPGFSAGSHDLWEARIFLLCVLATVLLAGVLSLVVE
ncbi:hypothetical protein MC885_009090 [Smutsia gigantea]|nr:hypothetical protein MC885_009090 [Smutsia gigantea]